MTLRDAYGEIEASPGDYFKIGESLLEIVCEKQGLDLHFSTIGPRTVWCRVVEGLVAVDEGRKVGPGSIIDINPGEVAGDLRAYRLLNGPRAPTPARLQQPAQAETKERSTRKSKQRPQNDHQTTEDLFQGH